jgi:hypothetical protein
MAKRQKKRPTPGDVMVIIGITALMGLAIREQWQMPPEERTWHGTLYGIPYDFRPPTTERLRETFWNKDTARVLVPQFFGMGWSINFYRTRPRKPRAFKPGMNGPPFECG